jgi:hypothetical protein
MGFGLARRANGLMGLTRRAASRHKSTSRWQVGRLAQKVELFFPVAAAVLTGRLDN